MWLPAILIINAASVAFLFLVSIKIDPLPRVKFFVLRPTMSGRSNRRGDSSRSVFVGNIPYDATEEQLTKVFETIGPVVSFRLVFDDLGKPKGYGFCEYRDAQTAQSAVPNLNGCNMNSRPLRVYFAESDEAKGIEVMSGQNPSASSGRVGGNPSSNWETPAPGSLDQTLTPEEQVKRLETAFSRFWPTAPVPQQNSTHNAPSQTNFSQVNFFSEPTKGAAQSFPLNRPGNSQFALPCYPQFLPNYHVSTTHDPSVWQFSNPSVPSSSFTFTAPLGSAYQTPIPTEAQWDTEPDTTCLFKPKISKIKKHKAIHQEITTPETPEVVSLPLNPHHDYAWNILLPEIWEKIFLFFTDSASELISKSCVCKKWRACLLSKKFWTDLDLRGLTVNGMKQAGRLIGKFVEEIQIDRIPNSPKIITKYFPNTKTLSTHGFLGLAAFLHSSKITSLRLALNLSDGCLDDAILPYLVSLDYSRPIYSFLNLTTRLFKYLPAAKNLIHLKIV